MSDPKKVSAHELSLLEDQSFLLTKRVIDGKVTRLLLKSQETLKTFIHDKPGFLPKEIGLGPKKITKGENYQSLPYWVSDFPAVMNQRDIWAFRSVVWWGHELSFSLILKGIYKPQLADLQFSKAGRLMYHTHSDPWKLELVPEYAISFEEKHTHVIQKHLNDYDFIKLTIKSDLNRINQLPDVSVNSFDKLIRVLNYLA